MPARQSKPSSHPSAAATAAERSRSLRLKLALAATCLSLCTGSAAAATFNVDTTADAVDANTGDGLCVTAANQCSLRAAVQQANALGGVNTINVPAGTYVVDPALGRITIANPAGTLTINGTGASGTSIIDGADLALLFGVQSGTATFNNLVLQRGYSVTYRADGSVVRLVASSHKLGRRRGFRSARLHRGCTVASGHGSPFRSLAVGG